VLKCKKKEIDLHMFDTLIDELIAISTQELLIIYSQLQWNHDADHEVENENYLC